jgi:DNA-binding LacI/PurR family transcriptional regulator
MKSLLRTFWVLTMFKHARTTKPAVSSSNREQIEEAIRSAGYRLERGNHGSLKLMDKNLNLLGIVWVCNGRRTISIKSDSLSLQTIISTLEKQYLVVKVKN